MIGFKVTEPDYTCRGFKYEIGQTYEMDGEISLCDRGFHFCMKLSDCYQYYSYMEENHVLKVEALGEIDGDPDSDDKFCTNKIRIIEEIPWDEVKKIVNEGKECTGLCNTGNCNTGDCNTGNWNTGNCNTGNCNTGNRNTGNCNTGDCNTGDWNTGNCNTGNRNTGDCNTGNRNTGDWNTGNCNTGDWNTGNCNTGDWNKSSFNSGCFNTEDHEIRFFDKESDMTYEEWRDSKACYLLNHIPKNVVEWIWEESMTDEEKEENPTYKTTGGYLKVLDESDSAQVWWDGLNDKEREVIRGIPNFDMKKFCECTGIRYEEGDADV